jgi:hypothetical protein
MNIIGKANYPPENTTEKRLKSSMTDPSNDFRPSYRVITRSGPLAAIYVRNLSCEWGSLSGCLQSASRPIPIAVELFCGASPVSRPPPRIAKIFEHVQRREAWPVFGGITDPFRPLTGKIDRVRYRNRTIGGRLNPLYPVVVTCLHQVTCGLFALSAKSILFRGNSFWQVAGSDKLSSWNNDCLPFSFLTCSPD